MYMGKMIIMGAGGYTLEPESCIIDEYLLRIIGKGVPKICLLPTACGDRQETIERFHQYFHSYGAITSHVPLFSVEIDDIESHLLQQDGIYITGGNTKSMLALWKDWGIDHILQKVYESGVIIFGISAGAMCFFEEGFSDFHANRYVPLKGFGLLEGSFCPHYIPGEERALAFQEHIRTNKIKPGIGLEDGVALYYENGKILDVIKSRSKAHAFRVDLSGNTLIS